MVWLEGAALWTNIRKAPLCWITLDSLPGWDVCLHMSPNLPRLTKNVASFHHKTAPMVMETLSSHHRNQEVVYPPTPPAQKCWQGSTTQTLRDTTLWMYYLLWEKRTEKYTQMCTQFPVTKFSGSISRKRILTKLIFPNMWSTFI